MVLASPPPCGQVELCRRKSLEEPLSTKQEASCVQRAQRPSCTHSHTPHSVTNEMWCGRARLAKLRHCCDTVEGFRGEVKGNAPVPRPEVRRLQSLVSSLAVLSVAERFTLPRSSRECFLPQPPARTTTVGVCACARVFYSTLSGQSWSFPNLSCTFPPLQHGVDLFKNCSVFFIL